MSDRSRSRSRTPRWRRAFLAASAGVSALVMVVAAVGLGTYFWVDSKLVTIPEDTVGGEGDPAGGAAEVPRDILGTCAERACNYLLLGSDSREGLTPEEQVAFGTDEEIGGENRSDTIILVHTRPGRQEAIFLSFPRDLWVEIPGVGMGKINSAFEGGIEGNGAPRVARTVRTLTGMPIHHVLYVSLAGFQGLVDALGGVDLCVPYPMQDVLTGLDIPAGCQTFDGSTALAYVRTRHQPCDAVPDFARISRQQQFLRAVVSELLSPSELVHLPGLVPELLENLVVDQGLNPAELAYLAGRLQGVGTENADFRAVPTVPGFEGTLSVVRLQEPAAGQLFQRIREGKPLGELGTELASTPPSPANIVVSVVNADAGPIAANVFNILTEGGFNTSGGILDRAEIDAPQKGSMILYREGEDAEAEVVATYFSNLDIVPAPDGSLPDGQDVAVIVGGNYSLPEPETLTPDAVECPA